MGQNIDEAIDTLQACLRVLDMASKVGGLLENDKYYSALRVSPTTIPRVLQLTFTNLATGRPTNDTSEARASLPIRLAHALLDPLISQRDQGVRDPIIESLDVRGKERQSRGWQERTRRNGGTRATLGSEETQGEQRGLVQDQWAGGIGCQRATRR